MRQPLFFGADAPSFAALRGGASRNLPRSDRCARVRWRLLSDPACRLDDLSRLTRNLHRKDRLMPTGTVKWFNTTKGFGFIAPDGGGKDVFVHISAVQQAGMTGLPDNMKISFELRDGRDGRASAVELKKIG